MMLIDVSEIYEQINGYKNICFPQQDANGKWILSELSLSDELISDMHEIINDCPRIEYKPKKINI